MENYEQQLYAYLSTFISEKRRARFEEVIAQRTRYMTVVLEDIYQPHNASAVLRSAECLGIQDIHIIENRNKYNPNPDVALGSFKWLTLHRYSNFPDNTSACIRTLRKQGYRIVAATPHEEDADPESFDIDSGKFALFFGTELEGISDTVAEEADAFLRIPMHGFTESFNISVSAAICMYALTKRIRLSSLPWQTGENEKNEILLGWVKNSLTRPDLLEEQFRKDKGL